MQAIDAAAAAAAALAAIPAASSTKDESTKTTETEAMDMPEEEMEAVGYLPRYVANTLVLPNVPADSQYIYSVTARQLVSENYCSTLKACARRWGLRVSGNKTTLATRIVAHYNNNPGTALIDLDNITLSQRGPLPQIILRHGQEIYPKHTNQRVLVISILNWNERQHRYELEVAEPDSGRANLTYNYSDFHTFFTESPPHRDTPAPTPTPPVASNSTATAAVTTPSRMSPIDIKLANDAYLLSMPPPTLHVGQFIYSKCANKYVYTVTRINVIHRDTLCFEYLDILSKIKDLMYCTSFHLHMSIYPHAVSPSQLRL
jgi:hypothetical protein